MIEGEVGQHFAIQPQAFLAECVNEPRVAESFGPDGGIDTGNPEATVEAFFALAVAKGVAPTFFEYVFGDRINFGAGTDEAFCGFHDFPAASARGRVVRRTWH